MIKNLKVYTIIATLLFSLNFTVQTSQRSTSFAQENLAGNPVENTQENPAQATSSTPTASTPQATPATALRIISDSTAETCSEATTRRISIEINTFYFNLDDALKSAELNSENLNYLFRIYRDAQYKLNSIQEDLTQSVDQDYSNCINLIKNSKETLQKTFLQHYYNTAAVKRNLVLFEKYDSINTRFETIFDNVRYLDSDIKKFNNLLPCFTQSCVKK